ncbi:MAG: phage major capsid protein [Chloroflexi bacterium]|nr:phage major capsid protein [Chloroflexota bacterium]
MSQLIEKRNELKAKHDALAAIFAEAGPERDFTKITTLGGDTKAKIEEIGRRNTELTALHAEVEGLVAVDDAKANVDRLAADSHQPANRVPLPAAGQGRTVPQKSLGELVTESKAITGYRSGSGVGPVDAVDIELKALFLTTAGWPPESTRSGVITMLPERPAPHVIEAIAQGTTAQASYRYMRETTATNTAAEIAEGAPYPEAALEIVEDSVDVRKIAVWLPVTDEQLEDVAGARDYIDQRLTLFLQQRLDFQVLNGNGTPPNILGTANVPGVLTQALGTDTVADALYIAMRRIRVEGRGEPTVVFIGHAAWQGIRLLKTTDGQYIYGHPAEAAPARIWGIPVVETSAVPTVSGTPDTTTAIVGDYRTHALLVARRGVDVQVTNAHEDFFTHGKLAIRADVRVALVTLRPSAFCLVTGLAA